MTTSIEEREVYGGAAPPCFACGEASQAVWHGHEDVGVCGRCASSVLPGMLADAIGNSWFMFAGAGGGDRLGHINSALKRFERRFWRALFLVSERHRNGRAIKEDGMEPDPSEAAAWREWNERRKAHDS